MLKKTIAFTVLSVLLFTSCQQEKNKKENIQKKRSCLVGLPQKEILTRKGIDSVLAQFKHLTFKELDSSYICYSDPKSKFCDKLEGRTYYLVEGDDVFIPVVGKYRINQFVTRDKYYRANMKNICANKQQFWLVDKKVLYMMLDLIKALDKKGYDKYAFTINTSHRHPLFNEDRAHGARFSQHIFGRAIDISVKDINKDKRVTKADKKIVLAMLENIVGNKGGVGKYPGTMAVHFDCRGFRARWDHQ